MTSTSKTKKASRRKADKSAKSKTSRTARSRIGLVVLGMHRSGANALSGLLDILGCDMPATPVQAASDNAKGSFGSLPLCAMNRDLLHAAASKWDDWLPFPANWYDTPLCEDFRVRADAIVQEEFGRSRLFVLNDPHICRLVPFWHDVLDGQEIDARYVLTHRNPLEVTSSLEQRDGIDRNLGLLIWLRHVLEAEAATRGRQRVFTSYDRLMGNWAGVAEAVQSGLDLYLPRLSHGVAAEVETFLSADWSSHRKTSQDVLRNPLLTEWVRDAYAVFERWADEGEDKAGCARLDAIRQAFDTTAPAFVRLVQIGAESSDNARALADEKAAMAEQLAVAEHALEAAQQELADVQHALANAEQDHSAARATDQAAHDAALSAWRHKADQAEQRHEKAEAELVSLHDAKTVLAEKNAVREQELEDQLKTLRDDLAATQSALEQRRHETEDTARELRELKETHEAELAAAIRGTQEAQDKHAAELLAAQERQIKAERQARDMTEAYEAEATAVIKLTETVAQHVEMIADLDAQLITRTQEMRDITQLLADNEDRLADQVDAAKKSAAQAIDAARQDASDQVQQAKQNHETAVAAMRKELDKARDAHKAAEDKVKTAQSAQSEERKRREGAEAALKDARARAEHAEKKVKTMVASKSWRVTAPLRKIVALVSRSG